MEQGQLQLWPLGRTVLLLLWSLYGVRIEVFVFWTETFRDGGLTEPMVVLGFKPVAERFVTRLAVERIEVVRPQSFSFSIGDSTSLLRCFGGCEG